METDNTQSTTPDNNTQPKPEVTPGVQARIDELVGRQHEKDRQLEQMNQTMQELIAQNAALAARQSQVAIPQTMQPQLPEGVDPAMAQFFMGQFDSMLKANAKQMEDKLHQVVGGIRQTQEQMEFQSAAQGRSPEVIQRAAKLLSHWKRIGASGFTQADALVYAEGQLAEETRNQQRKQRPNGDGNDTTTLGGGAAPSTQRSALPPPKSDEEIRRMSPAQQVAYYEARVGDSEIV